VWPPSLPEQPTPLPVVFIDRSLGRIRVPALLRAAGIELVTLAEHYGMPADESVEDVTWLAECARQGWIAFMKDERIRRRPAERLVLQSHGVRCFCITNMNLDGPAMAQRYLANLDAITAACRGPGPFMFAVHANRIERLAM
jgi:hypothetical protein